MPRRGRHGAPKRERPRFLSLLFDAIRMSWRADRSGFIGALSLQLVGALAPTALVLIGQYLLNDLLRANRPTLHNLLPPVIALALLSALATAASALQQQQQRLLAERVSADTWDRVLDISGRVRLEMYESPAFFDQLQRIKNNAITQPITVTTSLFGLLGSVVGVAGLLVVVLTIAPLLVPLMFLAGLPTLLLARRVSRLEFDYLVQGTPIYRARQYLRNILTGREEAKEIRVFGAEPALRRRHEARRREFERHLARHTRRRMAYAFVSVALSGAGLAVSLAFVVWMLTTGRIPLGAGAAAVLAVRFLATSLDQLFRSVGGLFEASVYLADLDRFQAIEVDPPSPTDAIPPLGRSVDLSGVSFVYPGTDRRVLRDVSMTIAAGEIVALVGENGSGKTTLAKLIAGLYPPTDGTICWDDHPYSKLSPDAVQRHVAVIFQDFVRYQLSALDNIGLGDPDHAEDETAARAAAEVANAISYIDSLPHGLHTVLSREFAEGADLSVGQWQRLALARALRKTASLVILDEPSASLDPRAEADLFADIRRTLRGRSALLISHRFSSVRLADRIYVLRAGSVVESGSHDALVARGGLYAELFALQGEAYH